MTPRVRRPVAVLLSRFPVVTETFILREVEELEARGQPVVLAPLLREHPDVVHHEARPWLDRLAHVPMLSPQAWYGLLEALVRKPWRVLRAFGLAGAASWPSPGLLMRTLALFPSMVALAEELARRDVQHLHAHFATHPATAALVISELTGVPFSVTAHAHDIFVSQAGLGTRLRRAAFVRCISEFNRRFLAERFPAVADRLRVVHMGIPVPEYAGITREETSPPRLLAVAALKPYKGLRVLLEACRRLRSYRIALQCEIVGEGPERAALEKAIRDDRLESDAALLGARRQDEVRPLLAGTSVFVMPSVVAADGQMEGIPVALMEAMAAGVPVVASSLSGIPELVEDGETGLLVTPGSGVELAAALERLLKDRDLAARLAEAGRRRVAERFELGACTGALLQELDAHTAALEETLAAQVAMAGLPGGPVGARRLHRRQDSDVLELMIGGRPPGAVVLKQHRERAGASRPAEERAQHEAERLATLAVQLEGAPATVPRVLARDGGRLLLEHCPGVGLDTLLRRARFLPQDKETAAALRAAGGWLRALQEQTQALEETKPRVDELVAQVDADLEQAVAARRLSRRAAKALRARVAWAAPRARARGVVGVHGDLWPGNVLVAPERVTVLDLEGYRTGLWDEDPAYFLAHAELYFGWPGLRERARPVLAPFWEGFGRVPGGPTWELCRAVVRARLLAAAAPRRRPDVRPLPFAEAGRA